MQATLEPIETTALEESAMRMPKALLEELLSYLAMNLKKCEMARLAYFHNAGYSPRPALLKLVQALQARGYEFVDWEGFSYACFTRELTTDLFPVPEVLAPKHVHIEPAELIERLPLLMELQNLMVACELLDDSMARRALWYPELLRFFSIPLHSLVRTADLDALAGSVDLPGLYIIRIRCPTDHPAACPP